MIVSIFKNFNEVVQNQKISEVLNDIKIGKYKNIITYLRKSLADNKMEAYERAKKSLPAFTPSASFKGGRKLEFVSKYTQILVLDIDKLTPEQLTNAKALAMENLYTYAAFTSPSGNGLKILVQVNSKQEQHREAFLKLQQYYEKLLALPIDKSGKDLTRLCFVSYDTELFLNENASVFPLDDVGHFEPVEKSFSNNPTLELSTESHEAIYEHCIRFTEKKESYVNGNRNNFVHLLACNLNRKGVPLPVAMGYILADYNYDASEVMATVNLPTKIPPNTVQINKIRLSFRACREIPTLLKAKKVMNPRKKKNQVLSIV